MTFSFWRFEVHLDRVISLEILKILVRSSRAIAYAFAYIVIHTVSALCLMAGVVVLGMALIYAFVDPAMFGVAPLGPVEQGGSGN